MGFRLHGEIKSASTKRGFTLVEILAVLGIIIMLLGVIGSGFGGFGAQKLSTAATTVTTTLHEARSIALGETTPTRFAIDAEVGSETYMRAVTILKWQREVAANGGVTGSWVQEKPWTLLPEEVVFEVGQPPFVTGYMTYGGDNWTDTNGDYFTDTADYLTDSMPNTPDYVFIEFKPSGYGTVFLANGERAGERNVHLVMVEGYYEGAGVTRLQERNQDPTTLKNWAHLVVDSVKGRIKVYRP